MNYIMHSNPVIDSVNIGIQNYHNNIKHNRNVIQNTASKMLDMIADGELESVDCPVDHRFVDGLYVREILMPKGTRIIGKIHATEHWNILLTGEVTVITAEGTEHIKAPHAFISKAGVQKVVVMKSDCIWQTLHITDKTDLKEIEKEVIVESYDQLLVDGLLHESKRVEL